MCSSAKPKVMVSILIGASQVIGMNKPISIEGELGLENIKSIRKIAVKMWKL